MPKSDFIRSRLILFNRKEATRTTKEKFCSITPQSKTDRVV